MTEEHLINIWWSGISHDEREKIKAQSYEKARLKNEIRAGI